MKKYLIVVFLLITSVRIFSVNNRLELSTQFIPDSLKKDAYCVVRFDNTRSEYKSKTSGVNVRSKAITILDNKGKELSIFAFNGDKFNKLKKFTGMLYDGNGKLLQKFGLSDLNTTEYSGNYTLASDDRLYYFECQSPVIPFTIVYEYESENRNGLLYFPIFYPQYNYSVSVENASYELILPQNTEIVSKAVNFKGNHSETCVKNQTIHSWNIQNLKAITSDKLAPEFSNYVPKLYVIPKNFTYDDIEGDISCVKSIGIWQNKLNEGRNTLSDELKNKITELTKGTDSDREKVRILYDFLGNTTRYVSIQLGIGGYQPIPAEEVSRTGFGDCKGLTNYLKSMLEAINIPSNYCIINLDQNKKNLSNDFSSFFETNHIVLQVPLAKDTLWLECTNPRVPFGFIHNGIAGHNAIVVTKQGGKMMRLPDYPDPLNIEKNIVTIVLKEDGSADVTAQKNCKAKIYDQYDWFNTAKLNEQTDYIRGKIKIPNVTMGALNFKEDKTDLPTIDINYSLKTSLYGTKSGNRLFVPINSFRETYNWIKNPKRTQDVKINTGFNDIDSICINIPAGYKIESMPATKEETSQFGKFISSFDVSSSKVIIKQSLLVKSGDYPAESYAEFVDFMNKVSAVYKGIIIFRKESI